MLLNCCLNVPSRCNSWPNCTCSAKAKLATAIDDGFPLVQPAVKKLQGALANTSLSVPRIPVISNVDAQPHSDPDVIKNLLADQVSKQPGLRFRMLNLGKDQNFLAALNVRIPVISADLIFSVSSISCE